jgi:hypothetical protein
VPRLTLIGGRSAFSRLQRTAPAHPIGPSGMRIDNELSMLRAVPSGDGVLGQWSIGVLENAGWTSIIPSFHHSIIPSFHYSMTPHQIDCPGRGHFFGAQPRTKRKVLRDHFSAPWAHVFGVLWVVALATSRSDPTAHVPLVGDVAKPAHRAKPVPAGKDFPDSPYSRPSCRGVSASRSSAR